jgi:hypothetical protein
MAERAVQSLHAMGIQATVHSIVSVLPNAEALVKFGVEIGASLVVMGAFASSTSSTDDCRFGMRKSPHLVLALALAPWVEGLPWCVGRCS